MYFRVRIYVCVVSVSVSVFMLHSLYTLQTFHFSQKSRDQRESPENSFKYADEPSTILITHNTHNVQKIYFTVAEKLFSNKHNNKASLVILT